MQPRNNKALCRKKQKQLIFHVDVDVEVDVVDVQGKSVKFETKVGREHILADGDIVTFIY